MFELFAIFATFGSLILIAILVRTKGESWNILLEKEYVPLLIVVPTLSLSLITFLFTRQVSNFQLQNVQEQKRAEFGRRKLQEQVVFKFSLIKKENNINLDVWYEKTPETLTPKNITITLIPILMRSESKENVPYQQLRKENLTIWLGEEALDFKNGRCRILAVRRLIQGNIPIHNYVQTNQLIYLGVAIEVCYNGVQGYLEPLKHLGIALFPEGE
jgi:hypothetical protein